MAVGTFTLGLVIKLEDGISASFRELHELGLPTCQVSTYEPQLLTEANAKLILDLQKRFSVRVTLVWAGWSGRVVWDFLEGPDTVGLVPLATRRERVGMIKRASDFARILRVDSVATHAGFIPEAPSDASYAPLLAVLKDIARYCKSNGQYFCLETGQETPTTLLRVIEDLAEDNVRVNFDPANLILYGKGNPVDALGILGPYVNGVHLKDGRYPVSGRNLGVETFLGQGQVDIPVLIQSLRDNGYHGPLSIETDLRGASRLDAINRGLAYLSDLFATLS